jgi:hypothetical protein
MPDPMPPSGKKSVERAARAERLASALRENLRRRKEQVRAQQQRAKVEHPKGTDEPTA